MMTLRFSPAMLAFKSKMPEEMRRKVDAVVPALRMSAPLAMVKLPEPSWVQLPRLGQTLPLTSIVTLLFSSAAEMTFAAPASITKSIGSSNHNPVLPFGALVFTLN